MFEMDGKEVDLTKPQTWGNSIQLKPSGSITQLKNGVVTKVEHVEKETPKPNRDLLGN